MLVCVIGIGQTVTKKTETERQSVFRLLSLSLFIGHGIFVFLDDYLLVCDFTVVL